MQSGNQKYKILVLGAGLMAPPLIDYLNSFKDSKITIASNIIEDAQKLAQRDPENLEAAYIQIDNSDMLENLVKEHQIVVSFIPPFLHHFVAEACLKLGKNMTTSSYISQHMKDISQQVKDKDLIFLNECGLDPGIDIMGTMKVVHEANLKGYKVFSYESYCGGLPVAEQADENPLGYKFSWNPGAAIKASRNKAIFKKDDKVIEVDECLKEFEIRNDFSCSMKLETYPNRDSLSFQENFGMIDCLTFIRGTIRYEGFSCVISAFHDLGLTSDEEIPASIISLKDALNQRITQSEIKVKKDDAVQSLIQKVADQYKIKYSKPGIEPQELKTLIQQFLERVDFLYLIKRGFGDQKIKQIIQKSIETLDFLEFFNCNYKITRTNKSSYIDILSEVMQKKLAMNDHDRDLVIMRHEFGIEDPNSGKKWKHTSTLIASGQSKASGGSTIMSQTVGITCGIATRLVLVGKIQQRGVVSPIYPEIYNPILKELESFQIQMKDDITEI